MNLEEALKRIEELENKVSDQEKEIDSILLKYEKVCKERDEAIKNLYELVEGRKIETARIWSKKSESHILINEAESSTSYSNVERTIKNKPGRKAGIKISESFLSSHVKKEIVIVPGPEYCPECGKATMLIGFDKTIKIEMTPMEVKVIEYHYEKRVCHPCENIYQAEHSFNLGGYLTPSFIAAVIYNKYVLGIPLYRMESHFKEMGINISRQALSNYIIDAAGELEILYNRLKEHLIHPQAGVIHADETTLEVLELLKNENRKNAYMWLYASTFYDQQVYIYDFENSRGSCYPKEFLKDYKGYLVVDGYDGYNNIDDVSLCGCWAHARRKFTDIIKGLKDERKESSLSSKFIKLIDKLFILEEEYHNQCQTVDEIKQRRLKESKAILDEYFTLASSSLNSSDGALRKAINYSLEQKEKLSRFLEDGHIPLSNNLAERGIKPFVICRKNFLFSNTIQGAKASAIIFSIIQTARANGINIFNYLQRLFIKLPETPISQVDQFLPWNNDIFDEFGDYED